MSGREIEVTVTLKIKVDVEAWDCEYGTGTSAKAVRDDVKSYFGNALQGHHLVESGIITDSDWK
jgi:hypothetical protein